MWRDFKMVAPSLVTVTSWPLPVDCKILSWQKMKKQEDDNSNKLKQAMFYNFYNTLNKEEILPSLLAPKLSWPSQQLPSHQ